MFKKSTYIKHPSFGYTTQSEIDRLATLTGPDRERLLRQIATDQQKRKNHEAKNRR